MKRAIVFVVCLLTACRDGLAPADSSPISLTPRSASVISPSGVEYSAIDLGALPGGNAGAIAINANGQIAGTSSLEGNRFHAVFWNVDGVIRDLGTLGGKRSTASALNASGSVIGWSRLSDEMTFRGFIWEGQGLVDLGTLPGHHHSFPYVINDNGVVIGTSFAEDFSQGIPFRWQNGVMSPMESLGGVESSASAINFIGTAVGYSLDQNGDTKAVMWQGTVLTELEPAGSMFSNAVGINDAGQVIGWFFPPGEDAHGFLWEKGVLTDLGSLGAWGVAPMKINARGDIVGSASAPDGQSVRAFLWRDGTMLDLGTLPGYQNSSASSINDEGQIAGYAWNHPGPTRALLWENGVMIDLGLLPNTDNAHVTEPNSINNRGQIIGGGGLTASNNNRAILWQPSDPVTMVAVDIKPGTEPNVLSVKSNGVIPVAILGTTTFDATTVEVATVRFGPSGAAETHATRHIEDANADGIADLILHFATPATGIACGQTSAILTGKTLEGRPIRGTDAIQTNPCR